MSDFFDGIAPVAFKGPDSDDPLAFRFYEPERMVMGKRMEDHLRVAVCYWHSFNWPGSDVFGVGTFDRPWLDPRVDPMTAARAKLDAAFDYMAKHDPFSGHVVIRSTDSETTGSAYRLWTTIKVPQGFSMQNHCEILAKKTGAASFRIMPAKKLFALGVGHVRRRGMEPGSRTDEPGSVIDTNIVTLSDLDWKVLGPLKRELSPDEIGASPWRSRAREAGVAYEEFLRVARSLNERKVIGRFSTFLEHVKPSASGERVTRYNALFHWRVPEGREIEAGREVGRHHILTHAYWREGGPEFANVNIMAVAHGTEKSLVLAHKAAIDAHLAEAGIPVLYTNVFWGGRSEIKPSEISPAEYEKWLQAQ